MNIVKCDIWSYLKKTDDPVIIYGMGNGADKILEQAERYGIRPYGIMASDEFVRGQSFHGYKVKKLSDFESEISSPVILVSFGTQRQDVMDNILHISRKYTVLAPDVPVYGSNIFNRAFFSDHINELEMVYDLLADEHSRTVLENVINFKLTGELEYLTSCYSSKDEAFSLLCLSKDESFLDLGAYRGDTIQEFLHYSGSSYRHITALEPDRKTFLKLRQFAGEMHDTQLFNMGIWSDDTDLCFNASLGRGSSLSEGGSQKLPVTKIDTLCKRMRVSYIKIDVEGSELEALKGGINTLRRDKPKLNLALYHRSEDLFTLPLLLNDIQSGYKLYLRQHPHIPAWDLNLYAV